MLWQLDRQRVEREQLVAETPIPQTPDIAAAKEAADFGAARETNIIQNICDSLW